MRFYSLDLRAVVGAAVILFAPLPAASQTPIPLPQVPSAVAVNPVTNEIWVLGESSDTVMRVDGETHAVATAAVADAPRLLRVDPIQNRVYVLHAAGQVTVLDGQSVTPTLLSGPLGTGMRPGLAVDPARNRIYATASNAVRVIDGADLSVDSVPLATGHPQSLAVDPIADRAYTGVWQCCDENGNVENKLLQIRPDPPAVVDSIVLAAPFSTLIQVGVGADPSTGLVFSQLSNLLGDLDLFARTDWSTHGLFHNWFGGGLDFAIEPTGGRLWTRGFPFAACSQGGAKSLTTLALLPGTSHLVCNGGLTVNPATPRGYLVDHQMLGTEELFVWIVDPETPVVGSIALGAPSPGEEIAVNVATNRLYLVYPVFGAPQLLELDEPVAAPVPIDVAIAADPPTPEGSVLLHFSASTRFAPVALPIQHVYYQVDATDGPWTAAMPAGASGEALVTGLAPGPHVIHAFATDGQEATIASEPGQPVVVGAMASLAIEVPSPPACSNGVDDDGDGLTDHPSDPGCYTGAGLEENPKCDDELDNDGDGGTDWDGGAFGLTPDAQCVTTPWKDREVPAGGCGIGAEIALALGWLASRRVSRGTGSRRRAAGDRRS
jgi:DNA-binding beta-propeller fold protein YncE